MHFSSTNTQVNKLEKNNSVNISFLKTQLKVLGGFLEIFWSLTYSEKLRNNIFVFHLLIKVIQILFELIYVKMVKI